MKYKKYDCGNYQIHTIKTDKFKNCSMEIIFTDELKKENITINNLLCDILTYSNKKYQTRRDISIALENLYSTYIRGMSTRLGNNILTSFITDFLDPKYCEKDYLEEVIKFSFSLLLEPNIKNNAFDQRSFNIVKNRLKADIESLKENATKYAFRRALISMDSESASSYSMTGYLNDLEKITPANLVTYYQYLLQTLPCDIYIIGNLDMDKTVNLIKKYFKRPQSPTELKNKLYTQNNLREETIDITETGKYEQSTLVAIYNLDGLTKRERDIVFHLYNFILGSGSLTTKLYKYLREENSLCYIVSSLYQKYDQLLLIYAGIAAKDKAKCLKLIAKALDEMSTGNFTKEEVENAKKTLISSLKISEDTLGGIINNYLFKNIDNIPLNDQKIKELNSVTKKEIIDVAQKVRANTTYLLAEEEL